MKLIPLTKGKFSIVDDDNYEWLMRHKWQYSSTGYAKRGAKCIKMHREVIDAPIGIEVDHINGNKLDNRRRNLRLCRREENMQNRGVNRLSKTGCKGVSLHRKSGKYQVHITAKGIARYLGLFKQIEDAANAYSKAARLLHGEFRRLM